MNVKFALRLVPAVLCFSWHLANGQIPLPRTNPGAAAGPVRGMIPAGTNAPGTNEFAQRTNGAAGYLKSPSTAPPAGGESRNHVVVHLEEATLARLQPRPDGFWKPLQPFLSTLVGAVIALLGSYWATTRSHKLQVDRQKQQDAEFVRRLEACIDTELDFLGQVYAQGIGKDLAGVGPNEPLRVRLALTERWFTVFEANANHLGKLHEDTSQRIIRIYGLLKSMLEYFRINNLLLDHLDALEAHLRTVLDDEEARRRHGHLVGKMVQLAGMLRDLENTMKLEVQQFQNVRRARKDR